MHGDPVIDSTVLEKAQLLMHELIGLIHSRFRITALEVQLAGKSLVFIIIAGVMVGVLLSVAWLGLMAATVLKFIENGIMTSYALLLAVALNFLLMLILFLVIRGKSHYLQFSATRRSFQPLPIKHRNK
ncbi:MAG: phage holin family protein [Methylococcales bacterium]|nr:phage holin family protein [Methylococcales bacterium]